MSKHATLNRIVFIDSAVADIDVILGSLAQGVIGNCMI